MNFFHLTPVEVSALILSIKVALVSTVFSLIPAIAIAWILARKEFIGKSLLDSLIHLPLVLPPVVIGFVLLALLGNKGWIGQYLHQYFGITIAFTWIGAAVASSVMAFPLFVRAIRQAIYQVDVKLEEAAGTLGKSPWEVFLTITLPLSYSGILTGSILAFSRSLGEFGATITFVGNIQGETQTLPLAIYSLSQNPEATFGATRLVIISISVAFIALYISERLNRK